MEDENGMRSARRPGHAVARGPMRGAVSFGSSRRGRPRIERLGVAGHEAAGRSAERVAEPDGCRTGAPSAAAVQGECAGCSNVAS